MGTLRILVVEDSITVRQHLVDVLGQEPGFQVVGQAADGKQAIELCRALKPDVITLDMMLPVMTGLAVTEYIMAYCPTPILIVSSSTNRGDLYKTYDALAAGAVDVLEKPDASAAQGVWERQFIAAVRMVARIKVITHLRGRLPPGKQSARAASTDVRLPRQTCRVVAMGASTGGPGAVVSILKALPADFPTPILLVIHISKPFGTSFAEWLDGQSGIRVRCCIDGETLPSPGRAQVIMAQPDSHMVLRDGKLRLNREPDRHSCRPSVDVLFESVAEAMGSAAVGCLLTGMGRDGALGLLAMRQAGALTIAQDEASSVVYGMPMEAAAIGAAEEVLALDRIAPALAALPGGRA